MGWWVFLTFIPGISFYAFDIVRKLREYLLYVVLPAIFAISFVYLYRIVNNDFSYWLDNLGSSGLGEMMISIYITLAFQGLAVFLMVIWAREHNRLFDQEAKRQPPQ